MGKFTRALLLNAKGSVQVELEKKTPYAAGETIAGTVFVTVWEPIAAEGAVRAKLQYNAASRLRITSVLLSGQEKVAWGDLRQKDKAKRHVSELLDEKIQLTKLRQVYAAGEYEYSFTFPLPETLAGSLVLRNVRSRQVGHCQVRVTYKMTVVLLHGQRSFAAGLGERQRLTILRKPVVRLPRSIEEFTSETVNFLWCFDSGKCDIAAELDQDICRLGSILNVDCHVTNRSSSENTQIRLQLLQQITLLDSAHYAAETVSTVIAQSAFPGVRRGRDTHARVFLQVHRSIQKKLPFVESFQSELFAVNYVLRVTCGFFAASSATLDFPITVARSK